MDVYLLLQLVLCSYLHSKDRINENSDVERKKRGGVPRPSLSRLAEHVQPNPRYILATNAFVRCVKASHLSDPSSYTRLQQDKRPSNSFCATCVGTRKRNALGKGYRRSISIDRCKIKNFMSRKQQRRREQDLRGRRPRQRRGSPCYGRRGCRSTCGQPRSHP